MSIVAQDVPAVVPVRKVRRASPARAVEVAITHKRDGSWEIERESDSRPGLMYLIRVTEDGTATHDTGRWPSLVCAASEHGQHCKHLDDAPGLVGYGVEMALHIGRIAQERAYGPEWCSEEFIGELQARIRVCADEAAARYGVRITKVVEESAL